jgi:C-terminal processing protease CtpA/Prc
MTLDATELGYYLNLSFDARGGSPRYALNHLGIETTPFADGHLVIAALEGYPAHGAGIERGDVILTLNGRVFAPVLSLNPEARALRFFPLSETVDLLVRRDRDTQTLAVTPVFENLYDSYRTATSNSVLSFAAGNKIIGYLRCWALSRSTDDLATLRRLVDSLSETDGLVLDLRNSHGYLDPLHIDLFRATRSDLLTLSEPAITSPRGDKAPSAAGLLPLRERDDSLRAYRRPIAILIDSSTQGPAELLAYQLGKLARVTTVGTATPGRLGRYTSSREDGLNGERVLHYAPNPALVDGRTFEGVGITPKRVVAYPHEQVSRADPQFQAAVNGLMGVV